MHILMPDYSFSMPAVTVPPLSLSQHVSSSSSSSSSSHNHSSNSTYPMASTTTSHGHRGSAAALIADAASHAAYFHHAIARAPVSQWQKQQIRGRVRAHTTANGTLTELASKLAKSNAVTTNSTTISDKHRISSSTVNSLESEVPRIIWPFEQTVEDQADFASRVIYALWCSPDRPAQLPELEQVEFNVLPLSSTTTSSSSSSNHGYKHHSHHDHHTASQVLTFDHRSTSSLADYLCGQPAPEDYRQFCHEILRVTQLHPSVILLALYYVYRLVFLNPEIRGAVGSEMRVWTVALALSNKYLDDHTYRASTWRQLTGLSTKELTQMEFEMLQALYWSLHITPDSFRGWSHWLVHLRKHYNDRQTRLRRQPLAMEDAMLVFPITSTAPSNMIQSDTAAAAATTITIFSSPLLPDTNMISSQSAAVVAPAPSRSKRHWRRMSSEDLYAAVHGSTNTGPRALNGIGAVDHKQQHHKDSWTNVAVQRRRTSRYTCLPTAWSTQPSSTTTNTTSTNTSDNQYSHYQLPVDVTTAGSIHGKHTTSTTAPSSSLSSSSSMHQAMIVEQSLPSSASYPSDELIYTITTETSASMSMMRQAHDISLPPSLDMMNMSQFFPTVSHPSSLMTTPSNLSMALSTTTTTPIAASTTTNTTTVHHGGNHSTATIVDNSRRISVTGGGPLTPVEGQPIDSRLANIRTMAATMAASRSHSAVLKSTLYDGVNNNGNMMNDHHHHRRHHQHPHDTTSNAQIALNDFYTSQCVAQSLMSLQQQPQQPQSQQLSSSSHHTAVVTTTNRLNENMYDGALPTPLVEQTSSSLTRVSSIPTPLPVISSHRMCHTHSTSSLESVPALSTESSHSATTMLSSNNNNNSGIMMTTEDDSILMDSSSMYGSGIYSSSSTVTALYDNTPCVTINHTATSTNSGSNNTLHPSCPSMIAMDAVSSTLNTSQAPYHYLHPVPVSSSLSLPQISSSSSSSVIYDDRMAVTPYLYHHGQSARLPSSLSSASLASVLQHHLHSHPMTVYPQHYRH